MRRHICRFYKIYMENCGALLLGKRQQRVVPLETDI